MQAERSIPTPTRILLALLPGLILAVSLGVTWFTWDHERKTNQQSLHSQFEFALRETVGRIEQRVQGYEQMLRGVQSLFATTALSDRAAMRDYVESLQLDANFSGIQAIGIVPWVPAERKAQHVAALRAAGFADYAIRPDGMRDAYGPIVQREPYVGRNRAALGDDVWLDPVRRHALERARDSGLPAISGKVQLKADAHAAAPPGFIMYLPVYASHQVRDTVEQRRAQLIGWVYASFHMNDFMASLYGNQAPGLVLTMYDGTDPSQAHLFYRTQASDGTEKSAKPAMAASEYMVVSGHSWTLTLGAHDEFVARYGQGQAMTIAVTGVGLSVLLALLTWMMVNGRERALRLAAAMTEELRHMAQRDPLTGLPNRALFSDRLNQEMTRAKRQGGRFALAFIDLDYFKPINDKLGHDVGDEVLRQVARRLSDNVREADTIGRIGGDEFVALLADLSDTEAISALAKKLHLALNPPLVVAGHELSVSCCIGVAVYPADGADAVSLTKSADEAMYRAKEAGRNCVRFCEPSDASSIAGVRSQSLPTPAPGPLP
jgi:diguanylate cyclase (GGDEF)-like protein